MTISNYKELMSAITTAKKSKQAYKDLIQEAIVYFVKEYNNGLSYNATPLKEIVECVGKDIRDLRAWLFTYTNLTKVYSDLLHFETEKSTIVKTKDGKKVIKYTLEFKDNFNGQTWYETADKTDKDEIKDFTNDNVKKSLVALYKKYLKDESVKYGDNEMKILKAIKTTYNI